MKLKIQRSNTRYLRVKDVERIMVGSEPFHTYGFNKKSCKKVVSNNRKNGLLLAKFKNEVVGFAIYEKAFLNGFYLKLIAVDPKTRSLGVGKKLMDELEKETFNKNKKKVLYLCVTHFNRRAQTFYKKRGYRKIGFIPNFAKTGIHEVLMRKVAK